jgi:hypothetical protein
LQPGGQAEIGQWWPIEIESYLSLRAHFASRSVVSWSDSNWQRELIQPSSFKKNRRRLPRDRQKTAKSGRSIFKKCNISDMASLMGWAPVDWGKHQIWVDTSCYLSPLLACRRSRELELVVSACPSTRHLKISVSWLRPSLALPLIRLVEFVMWAV